MIYGDFMEDRIELVDYISVERLQELQNSFSDLAQCGAAISDRDGSAITQSSGMCDFCKYIRVSRLGSERCRECDSNGAEQAFRIGKPVSYTCHAGLVDFVAPIVIDNQRVGCFSGGQVRLGEPDEEKVRRVAQDIGVNPEMALHLARRTPLLTEKQLQNAMAFIHNVTLSISDMAYKQYQIEAAKDSIEYASQLKEDLMANMSHEIRTPMNGVIGLADLALNEQNPDEVKRYLKLIKKSGRLLLTLVNDIMDLSDVESGSMDINEEEYLIKNILDEVISAVEEDAKAKNIELITNVTGNVPKALIGDSIRIGQVILNLVKNGVKFTDAGNVSVNIENISEETDTVQLKVTVKDTGIGISQENQQKIFQSFRQIDSKRNRQAEGIGIGLAIAKHLVEMMDGTIGVESTVGEGSKFFFTITQKKVGTDAEEEYPFTAPNAKILVVDDNNVNLKVAAGVLSTMGVKADTALSGALAVEMCGRTKYDIVFMDYMMPEMDGMETTQNIRLLYPEYEQIPIVALTANIADGTKDLLISAGLNEYATKPVVAKKMAQVLRRWLPKEKIIRSEIQEETISNAPHITIEGLDTKTAIEMLGTEEFYLDVLKNYLGLIDKKASMIREFVENEKWSEYTIQLHALKSSSKQIGAMELGDMAAELERAGNESDIEYIKANTEAALDKYLSLKTILAPLFVIKDEGNKTRMGIDELKNCLSELSIALDNLDMEGMNNCMDLINAHSHSDNICELITKLDDAIEMLDVDTAVEIVAEIENVL